MAPRVSVVIPTYNRTRWLAETIESVLGQTYADLELVVGDDASTKEDAGAVVARYDDPRLRYVRFDENAGIVRNFNRCIELAQGDYVLALGDDDAAHPELVERTVAVLDANPEVGVAHTSFDLIGPEGELVHEDVNWTGNLSEDAIESGDEFVRASMGVSCRICSSTALIRRSALPAGIFDPDEFPPFDFALWLRMALDWGFGFIADPLCLYRIHPLSHSSNVATQVPDGYLQSTDMVRAVRDLKVRFVNEHPDRYPVGEYTAVANRGARRELLAPVRYTTLPERKFVPTVKGLAAAAREAPDVLREPAAWSLLAGSLVGPRGVERLRRFKPAG
ncbi:MAG: glycosyltransferase family 2 protein [Thermoleophilaceae bacterium]